MLPKEVFASIATEPETELQERIEKLLDHDESLEENSTFLQNGSNALLKVTRFRWNVCTRIYVAIFAVQELSKELQ
jgi:hypothetical protein